MYLLKMKRIFHHRNNEGRRIVLTLCIAIFTYLLFVCIPSISFFFAYIGSHFSHDNTYASWSEMSRSLDEIRQRALLVPMLQLENTALKQDASYRELASSRDLLLVTAVPGTTAYDEQQIRLSSTVYPLGSLVYSPTDVPLGTLERTSGPLGVVSWWSSPNRAVSLRFATSSELFSAKGQGGGVLLSEVPRGLLSVKEGDAVYISTDPINPLGYISHIIDDPRDPFVRVTVSMYVSPWQVQYVYIVNE